VGALENHDFPRWMAESLPGLLPAFLPGRRWFGGKARRIDRVSLLDTVWPLGDARDAALAVIQVSFPQGEPHRYVLVLRMTDAPGDLPVIGPLSPASSTPVVVEAAAEPASAGRLVRLLLGTAPAWTTAGGRIAAGDLSGAAARTLADAALAVTALGSEQSNTSLRVGTAYVFKIFRRLDHGENPELEVSRFLTARTSFKAMCALGGSLSYVAPDDEWSTLGVMQDWTPNNGDGWAYTLARLRGRLAAGVPVDLLAEIAGLGVTTAEFHVALAGGGDPAFDPEPVEQADVDRWRVELLTRVARSVSLVEEHRASWPRELQELAGAFLDRASTLADRARAMTGGGLGGMRKIRIHGDYHLGQTLKTAGGFVLIDFEGEPARPIADRRRKTAALRDVAGMLRSFDYAIESAADDAIDGPARHRAAAALRTAFLDAYMAAADRPGTVFLPSDPAARAGWTTFFEIDKALYELDYEVNNRPAWVRIPLRGIVSALDT
jgi:trehalose synthase-fused probable maltokinase